jgi:hypothetical protein
MIMTRTIKSCATQRGSEPLPERWSPVTRTVFASISFALILELFYYCRHFSNFKMPEPHDLHSVLSTAPLCSRDGDGCHFERTAAQWLGVRPGYPQVRDGSVLRWILCAADSWMQSELLFMTLCIHDHCVSDCRIKICGRKWKVVFHVEGWELFVSQMTEFWYKNIYSCLYYLNSNYI